MADKEKDFKRSALLKSLDGHFSNRGWGGPQSMFNNSPPNPKSAIRLIKTGGG